MPIIMNIINAITAQGRRKSSGTVLPKPRPVAFNATTAPIPTIAPTTTPIRPPRQLRKLPA
jgi:hypothetical protein